MAVPALAFSEFFREKLESGRMNGTILAGEWKIPEAEVLVYSTKGNAEGSKTAERIGSRKIKACRVMEVSELSGMEAKTAGYADGRELIAAVKKWHGCADGDMVTFVEWE